MPYLVDGNNVMGQRVGFHKDRRRARLRLLDELADFAERRGATVAVVFDGAPDDFVSDNSLYRGVRVHYAARGSDADSRIRALAESSRERRTLLVVTSDRALADSVRSLGARVLRSGDLRRMLEDQSATEDVEASARKKEVRPDDTAHWLRYFGVGPEDE